MLRLRMMTDLALVEPLQRLAQPIHGLGDGALFSDVAIEGVVGMLLSFTRGLRSRKLPV